MNNRGVLRDVVLRNVFPDQPNEAAARAIASYMIASYAKLCEQSIEELRRGEVAFADIVPIG